MTGALGIKAARVAVVLAVFALWEILSRTGAVNARLLPSASDTLVMLGDLLRRASVRNDLLVTASEVVTAFFVAVPIGALIGFLIGAYLADAIGRKWTFFISAVSTVVMVIVYMYLPVSNEWLLWLGIPLSMSILMKFSPMGPFMTELYPTALRGTGQGFCYNGGRAIGSFFPTMVGYASQSMGLGPAIVLFACLASGLMIVMLPYLPETRGRSVATSEPAIGAAND